ncbi:hypothetical protein O3P69_014180 [Scylla paramamosain]|uniref:Uncharacterized protein n=1 Tax=Scylla paramamosain TaxID=85552 RepID=A0AAW0SET1_SCYPA
MRRDHTTTSVMVQVLIAKTQTCMGPCVAQTMKGIKGGNTVGVKGQPVGVFTSVHRPGGVKIPELPGCSQYSFSSQCGKMQLEAHHLKAAERPDQSGSCVKYCRPAAAVWECAAFWIKSHYNHSYITKSTRQTCTVEDVSNINTWATTEEVVWSLRMATLTGSELHQCRCVAGVSCTLCLYHACIEAAKRSARSSHLATPVTVCRDHTTAPLLAQVFVS